MSVVVVVLVAVVGTPDAVEEVEMEEKEEAELRHSLEVESCQQLPPIALFSSSSASSFSRRPGNNHRY